MDGHVLDQSRAYGTSFVTHTEHKGNGIGITILLQAQVKV